MHEVSLFSLHFLSTQHASPTRLHAGSIDGCAVPVRYVRPRSHHSPHEPLKKRKASNSLTAEPGKRLQFACDLTPVLTEALDRRRPRPPETLTVRDLDPSRSEDGSGLEEAFRRAGNRLPLSAAPRIGGDWRCLDRLA
ncbi:hypothetical protein HMPREF0972_00252 [Actinomyces sp. oral taxon 848 str. F0332]|nr:hypothetical protein HMPREF0972_00252 [Actinomyces sp. oral taxon 848 str. F0332]